MSNEVEIDGVEYRFDKLNAMDQFHVARKIAPLAPSLIPMASVKDFLDVPMEQVPALIEGFTRELAALDDAAAEYVINTCLSVVRRKTGEQYAPVYSAGALLFDDMDLSVMLRLVYNVLFASLGSFINGLLSAAPSRPEEK